MSRNTMTFHMCFLCKFFITDLTDKGLFSNMNSNMSPQIASAIEKFGAVFTNLRSFAGWKISNKRQQSEHAL